MDQMIWPKTTKLGMGLATRSSVSEYHLVSLLSSASEVSQLLLLSSIPAKRYVLCPLTKL